MVWLPIESAAVEQVAVFPVSGCASQPVMVVPPSVKLTPPVGAPAPGDVTLTVAVKVTNSPVVDGFEFELSEVVVLALLTVNNCVSSLNAGVPAVWCAVIVGVPAIVSLKKKLALLVPLAMVTLLPTRDVVHVESLKNAPLPLFLLRFTVVELVTGEAALLAVWDCTVTAAHCPTKMERGEVDKASFVGGNRLKVAVMAGKRL